MTVIEKDRNIPKDVKKSSGVQPSTTPRPNKDVLTMWQRHMMDHLQI
jgi:hypothetical protein